MILKVVKEVLSPNKLESHHPKELCQGWVSCGSTKTLFACFGKLSCLVLLSWDREEGHRIFKGGKEVMKMGQRGVKASLRFFPLEAGEAPQA